ncbi:unnamed protein product [Pleuronectes platessa]|uniref:Uncharacterized protein n=1 Tax=Pleuronectes platessa TaxID=8262 RepID=A0A9N7UC42_PLEPL|nr:unnamed protein product [Pleuronectes platessa]
MKLRTLRRTSHTGQTQDVGCSAVGGVSPGVGSSCNVSCDLITTAAMTPHTEPPPRNHEASGLKDRDDGREQQRRHRVSSFASCSTITHFITINRQPYGNTAVTAGETSVHLCGRSSDGQQLSFFMCFLLSRERQNQEERESTSC